MRLQSSERVVVSIIIMINVPALIAGKHETESYIMRVHITLYDAPPAEAVRRRALL